MISSIMVYRKAYEFYENSLRSGAIRIWLPVIAIVIIDFLLMLIVTTLFYVIEEPSIKLAIWAVAFLVMLDALIALPVCIYAYKNARENIIKEKL